MFLIENRYKDKSTYKFEDFFWTGSGDGPETESNPFGTSQSEEESHYKTKTIVTTVFIESPISSFNEVTSQLLLIKQATTISKVYISCKYPFR